MAKKTSKNMSPQKNGAEVAILMGSSSDWETLRHTAAMLKQLGISFTAEIVSAHRTPDKMFAFARAFSDKGVRVVVCGAGGAAHLPGMVAALTTLPVIGVPVESAVLRGVDSLLSIVQMPAGVPVATMAIGKAGAINAALFSAAILGTSEAAVAKNLEKYRSAETARISAEPSPSLS